MKPKSIVLAIAGCGGLGSWTALALARMGVGNLLLADPDRFDRTNCPRQLMFRSDIGVNKARALAQNLETHCTERTRITALPRRMELADEMSCDLLMVLTDNNKSRVAGSEFGLTRRIPVLFAVLADDGRPSIRLFAQLPDQACLRCALPDIDPEGAAACVPASIGPCLLAAGVLSTWTREILSGVNTTNWFLVDDLRPVAGAVVRRRRKCPCSGA